MISPNQFIKEQNGVSLFLKREDILDSQISGNKFRKLKYNIQKALEQGKNTLLTFGGAYSNHISATAAAAKRAGLKSIGVIRGEELGTNLKETLQKNPTLKFAASQGMKFEFISRNAYRKKGAPENVEKLREQYGDFYLIPEGGTNALAIKGCEEILSKADCKFKIICCPVGTGGTLAGIANSASKNQKIMGFSALKGGFLVSEVEKLTSKKNWEIIIDYHFGGYAKVSPELIEFLNRFNQQYGVLLDPIYTGKMMFGLFDFMEKGKFAENTCILAIHTGGLQGISGINLLLKKKNLPLIEF